MSQHDRAVIEARRRTRATIERTIETVERVIESNRRLAEHPDHTASAEERIREGHVELAQLRRMAAELAAEDPNP